MQTQIELLALDSVSKFDKAYELYEKLFSELSHDEVRFQQFNSTKAFFTNLAQAIKTSDILVLAVQQNSYIKVKDMLFRALKIKTDINSDILAKLMSSDSQSLLVHSTVPEKSKPLFTLSGEYSGFIHVIGKKAVIFLPLDNIDAITIDRELRKLYLPESLSKNNIPDAPSKPNIIKEESSEEEAKIESLKNTDKDTKKSEETDENDDKVLKVLMSPKTAIKKLKRDNISVAVASSRYSDFIFNVLNEDSAVIYPYLETDESEKAPSKKELASIASKVRKSSDSTLGVSLSNVFLSEGEDKRYYIYICIADDEQAHILKFNSKREEDIKDFLNYVVISFYSLLGNFADTKIIAVPKKRLSMTDKGKTIKNKSYKNTLFLMPLISAVLCIAIMFCTNIYHGTQAVMASDFNSSEAYAPAILNIENILGETLASAPDDGTDIQNIIDIELDTQESEESSFENSITLDSSQSETSSAQTQNSTSVNTTKKETTAKAPAITIPLSSVPITTKPIPSVRKGALQFTVYGYGHGVGMSQKGMREMANQGYRYDKILLHYYHSSALTIKNDPKMPKTGIYNGKSYPIRDYIGKTVKREIGESYNIEAIKAQVVAAYTYAMRYGFKTKTNNHAFAEDFDYRGTSIETAMNAVLGKYLDYQGKPAFCPYFSTSAGVTTKCSNVWGGTDYPYLMGGRKSPEDPDRRVLTISTDDFKKMVQNYNANVSSDKRIVLGKDPSKWIEILEHDNALGDDAGYVSKIRVGNQTMLGNRFRCNIVGQSVLRSHCFRYKFITT